MLSALSTFLVLGALIWLCSRTITASRRATLLAGSMGDVPGHDECPRGVAHQPDWDVTQLTPAVLREMAWWAGLAVALVLVWAT